MSKKEKRELSEGDVQTVLAMIPTLERLLETYKEVAKEYQKYRKNGGDEIPGLEKHLGRSETPCCHSENEEETVAIEDSKKSEEALIPMLQF